MQLGNYMIGQLTVRLLEATRLRMPRANSGQKLIFRVADEKGFSNSKVDRCAFYCADLTGTPFSGAEITNCDFTDAYVIALNPNTQRKTLVTGPFLKQYLIDVCGAKIDQETVF